MNPKGKDGFREDNSDLVGPMRGHTTPTFGEAKRINTIDNLVKLRSTATSTAQHAQAINGFLTSGAGGQSYCHGYMIASQRQRVQQTAWPFSRWRSLPSFRPRMVAKKEEAVVLWILCNKNVEKSFFVSCLV